jgi:hypothetical protein
MTVTLKPGNAYINGYKYKNDSDKTLTLDTADGVLSRIDRIVIRSTTLDREIKAYVKTGEFASSPVAPDLQRDADMWELGVADIYVANGAVSISQANITDLRLNNDYCGIVSGVIDQVDGENLFIQFQAIFNDFIAGLEDVLDENAAANLLGMINDIIAEIGDLEGLNTTEKETLIEAINELKANIEDIQSDITVNTSAISANTQGLSTQVQNFNDHAALITAESVLGHIKTNSVDANGNLIFDYGRYQADFGLDDAVLTGCFEKDGKVKLSNEWGTTSANVGPGNSGYSSINQYYGIRLNMTTLAGKLPKTFYLYQDYTTSMKPLVRLKNITTGEAGGWHESTTSTETSTYQFGPDEVQYASGDLIEIQIKGISGNTYTKYTSSQTITYISGKYAYTDDSFETLASTPSYYPYFSAMCYNVIPNTSGTVIKTVAPIELLKWGNLKWTQEVPTLSEITCDVLDSNNNVLKPGVEAIADLSDIDISDYAELKARWTLTRTDTSVKPFVSGASLTWEGAGMPLSGDFEDGQVLSISDGELKWLEGVKIVTGTYTGDGTTDRTINIGFTPKFIYISNPTYIYIRGTDVNYGLRFSGTGVAANWSETVYIPAIVANGFQVSGSGTGNTNQTSTVFTYTAIG